MVEYVKGLLIRWGEATFNGGRRGGGGSSVYPAYQLVHTRGSGGGEPPIDMDVLRVDAIMADIKKARPPLYQAAVDIYVQGLSPTTAAGRSRCNRDTIYSRLNSLHVLVANKMQERTAVMATTNH